MDTNNDQPKNSRVLFAATGVNTPPAMFGRFHLHQYVSFLAMPLAGAVLASILAEVFDASAVVWWVIVAGFVVSILWRVRQGDFSHREGTAALTIGGLLLGLAHAIVRFTLGPSFHLVFNLIAEPILMAGIGGLVGAASRELWPSRPLPLIDAAWRLLRKGVH